MNKIHLRYMAETSKEIESSALNVYNSLVPSLLAALYFIEFVFFAQKFA